MRFIIMASLAACSAATGAAAQTEEAPRIIVEGNGTVDTKAELATIRYGLRGEGKTSNEAVAALAAVADRVQAALRSVDPELEPLVDAVVVTEVRAATCKSRDYDEEPRLSTGPCAIIGYLATQRLTAQTRKVADAGTMVGAAGSAGAVNPEIDDFDLVDYESARKRAIAAALANAAVKARAIADGSGVRLGPVMSVSLDGARENHLIVVTGSRRSPPAEPQRDIIRMDITPKPISTTAQVTVSYGIQR